MKIYCAFASQGKQTQTKPISNATTVFLHTGQLPLQLSALESNNIPDLLSPFLDFSFSYMTGRSCVSSLYKHMLLASQGFAAERLIVKPLSLSGLGY
jgi:hypothetical protein